MVFGEPPSSARYLVCAPVRIRNSTRPDKARAGIRRARHRIEKAAAPALRPRGGAAGWPARAGGRGRCAPGSRAASAPPGMPMRPSTRAGVLEASVRDLAEHGQRHRIGRVLGTRFLARAAARGSARRVRARGGCSGPSRARSRRLRPATAARRAGRCRSRGAARACAGPSAALGQRLRLPLLLDLHGVLDVAQEEVRLAHLGGFGRRQKALALERVDGRRVPAPRTAGTWPPWISCSTCTTNSSSRMPPRPIFTLRVPGFCRRQLGVDAVLHAAQVLDRVVVEVAPVDERLERDEEAVAEREVAGRPGAPWRARRAPTCRPSLRSSRARTSTGLTGRPLMPSGRSRRSTRKTKPSPVVSPTARVDGRREVREELAAPGRLAVGDRVGLVHVDEIDVGAEVELAAAELAHAEHEEAERTPVRRRWRRRPGAPAARATWSTRDADRDVGELRQRGHGLVERRQAEQVARADAVDLGRGQPAQLAMQRRGVVCRHRGRMPRASASRGGSASS